MPYNGSFETPAANPTVPDGWSWTATGNARAWAEMRDDPGLPTRGFEDFEGGWNLPNAQRPFVGAFEGYLIDLEPVFFGGRPEASDGFEFLWPAPLMLHAELLGREDATFGPDGDAVEAWERDAAGDNLVPSLPNTLLEYAVWDAGGAGSFVETFLPGWPGETFEFLLVGAVKAFFAEPGGTSSTRETFEFVAPEFAGVVADPTTDRLTLGSGHGLAAGDEVILRNEGGRLPDGLLAESPYYVTAPDATSVQVAQTPTAPAVDFADHGVGTHYLRRSPAEHWTDVLP